MSASLHFNEQKLTFLCSLAQANCLSYGAQDTVEAVLSSPTFSSGLVGRHYYLCSGSILCYVIHQQTGKTPLQYAHDELFPALGITTSVTWQPTHGSNGIQEGGHGLVLGPLELAKLGQLYRQGGVTGAGTQLIPATFTEASRTDQLSSRIPSTSLSYLGAACSFKSAGAGYGYLKWLFTTQSGPVDCALGHQGQFICTWPDLDVIVAITSSVATDYHSSCLLLDQIAAGLSPSPSGSRALSLPPSLPPSLSLSLSLSLSRARCLRSVALPLSTRALCSCDKHGHLRWRGHLRRCLLFVEWSG